MPRSRIDVASLFMRIVIAAAGSGAAYAEEPIAFIGHGAMFDSEGNQIEVTPAFIEMAQQFYLDALLSSANDEQVARFSKEKARLLEGRNWDPQSKMIATAALVEWLLDEVDSSRLHDTRGKNRLIQQYLQSRLFPPAIGERFVPPAALADLLGKGNAPGPSASTLAERQAYIDECSACGVPTPPDWGSVEWVNEGMLAELETFISDDLALVEVFSYDSTTPRGTCIALPRATGPAPNDTIKLLGIICLGQDTSKACFWDNQENGLSFDIPQRTGVPLLDFEGGPGLFDGAGGVCTACHAGENPFVVHPNTALSAAAAMSDDWYEPLVHPAWPQNAGPSDLLDTVAPAPGVPAGPTAGCLSCHKQGGAGGRFPKISKKLDGIEAYCMILDKATAPSTASNAFTMPPNNQGGSPGHTMALLDECTVERPIPAFTINGVNPKHCDFAYSFCPPIGIVADGSISTTYGQTVYIWGLCPTEGLDLPCLPDSEIEFKPSMQATHDFGTLDVGTYRLHLRVLSDSFDERKSLDVSICSGNKVPSVSGWGLATMTAVMISAGALLAGRRAKERATPLL